MSVLAQGGAPVRIRDMDCIDDGEVLRAGQIEKLFGQRATTSLMRGMFLGFAVFAAVHWCARLRSWPPSRMSSALRQRVLECGLSGHCAYCILDGGRLATRYAY